MLLMFSLFLVLVLVCVGLAFFGLAKRSHTMAAELGAGAGELSPCPDSPNCVCSFAEDARHAIEPIQGGVDAFNVLRAYLKQDGQVQIMRETDSYLHATIRSTLFGFADDLELLLHNDDIHVRSASRVGHSDLGANRKRVDALRKLVTQS